MDNNMQQRYDALEAEKAALNLNNSDDKFRLTVIEQEQAGIRTQLAGAERLERQAAEVAEIDLPYDYDELWVVSGANAEIRGLIRQVKEHLFTVHNDEMAKLAEGHRLALEAATAQVASISTAAQNAQADLEIANELIRKQQEDLATANERLADAEKKRDNAVHLKEEAEAECDQAKAETASYKRQIDELEGMLRTYKSQKAGGYGGGLKLTSTIAPESKEDELNRILQRRGLAPLPLPQRPEETVTQEDISEQVHAVEEAAEEARSFPEVVHDDTAGSEAAAGAEEAPEDAGAVPPSAYKLSVHVREIDARLKAVERHLGIDSREATKDLFLGFPVHAE